MKSRYAVEIDHMSEGDTEPKTLVITVHAQGSKRKRSVAWCRMWVLVVVTMLYWMQILIIIATELQKNLLNYNTTAPNTI